MTQLDPVKDSTWEPKENLVGVANEIRDFERRREAEERAANEAILEKRRIAREAKEKEAAELRAAAAAAAADGEGAAGGDPKALPQHRQKAHPLWTCFDLTVLSLTRTNHNQK